MVQMAKELVKYLITIFVLIDTKMIVYAEHDCVT